MTRVERPGLRAAAAALVAGALFAGALLLGTGAGAAEEAPDASASGNAATDEAAAGNAADGAAPITAEEAAARDPDGRAPLDDPLTCLARTVYWEAKGEAEAGQRAVAHAVLNRVAADAFPDGVCAVVKQGGARPPCQFSWWCDGRGDAAREREAFLAARRVARAALNGASADPTGGATMFHARRVRPGWTRRARLTAEIGRHRFYVLK